MIYFTADHHFGHERILEYDPDRPFSDIEEHDRSLIELWNRSVDMNDWVIHLGDFSLTSPERTVEICRELNGHIILINGNHDHRTRTFWEDRCSFYHWFKRPQQVGAIWLTHAVKLGVIPTIRTGKRDTVPVNHGEDIVIHGHSHSPVRYNGLFINVSVNAWNFCPVPARHILPPKSVEGIESWIKNIGQ